MRQRRHPAARPIEDAAADWLARRDGGFSAEEAEAFERWRSADLRHEAAVQRLERTWELLQQLGAYRPGAAAHPDPALLAPPARRSGRPWRRAGLRFAAAMSAAAAIALAAAWWWTSSDATSTRDNLLLAATTHRTIPHGTQRLRLADDSVVHLQGDTEIRVRYAAAAREITLVRGQAHFTVARDPARPFTVSSGTVVVRAIGTAFDVSREAESVQVLVTAGTVELDRIREEMSPPPENSAIASAPRLTAGWQARVPYALEQPLVIREMTRDELRTALAWHGARLVFFETPLAEVVGQFNRHNDVQLSVEDPALRELRVGGSFSADNVEAFVRLLISDGQIVAERPAPDRIVLRKRP